MSRRVTRLEQARASIRGRTNGDPYRVRRIYSKASVFGGPAALAKKPAKMGHRGK